MDKLSIILLICAVLAIGYGAVATAVLLSARKRVAELSNEKSFLDTKNSTEQTRIIEAAEAKTRAETELREARRELDEIKIARDHAFSERNAALITKVEAERRAALSDQELESIKKQHADWEAQWAEKHDEMQKSTKSALFDTAKQLSEKLFEEHKREAQENRKQHDEAFKKTTDNLTQNIKLISDTVTSLNSQVKETREKSDIVWKALTSPSGAGQLTEIGLENTLRELGLELGRDFVMQQTIRSPDGNERLRPDAIVFVSSNRIVAIDSKASKHLVELSAAQTNEQEEVALKQLAGRMRQHLRDLAGKDYGRAIQAAYEQQGRKGHIRSTVNIMFIPSESIIERVKAIDSAVLSASVSGNVLIAGPITLASILGLARNDIELERQAENHEAIIEATRQLVDSIGTFVGFAGQVGKGLQTAANSYRRMVASINGRLLPRAKKLGPLGIEASTKAPLPRNLPAIELIVHDRENLIEGEAEDISDESNTFSPDTQNLIDKK